METTNWVKEIWTLADNFAVSHNDVLMWVSAILLKFLMDAMYIWAASPQFAYAGLVYNPSFLKYCISFFCYFLIFAILPKKEKRGVGALLHLQFVFTVAPMLTFYAFSGGSTRYMLAVVFCIVMQAYIVCRPMKSAQTIRITGIQN